MYKEIIKSHNGNKHYIDRYLALVERISQNNQNAPNDSDFHMHHILPKSLFPEYKKEKWNIIKVSIKTHYVLHHILSRAFGGKCHSAFYQMSIHPKLNLKITSRQYTEALNNFKKLNAGVCTYKNTKDGKYYRLNKNDEKIVSGEYVHAFVGKTHSEKTREVLRKTVVVYDFKIEKYVRVNNDDEYKLKIANGSYVNIGKKRDAASRKKTSEHSINRRFINNGSEIKFLKSSDVIPEGFKSGMTDAAKQKMSEVGKRKNFYFNPETGNQVKVYDFEVPNGYVRGRKNFGRKNDIMEWKYGINLLTGEKIKQKLNEDFPPFCVNKSRKYYYTYSDMSDDTYVSCDLIKLAAKFGYDVKVDMVNTVDFHTKTKKFSASLNDLGFRKNTIEKFKTELNKNWIWV